MQWTASEIAKYHSFTKNYIARYSQKIDCADLAIAALVEFSAQQKLPIRFKYYQSGWKWLEFDPEHHDPEKFKKNAMTLLGALNVIDNTRKIPIPQAKAGDFIMSKWNNSLGHTRVIHSITPAGNTFKVVWYQGNLPPVKPEKREDVFPNIPSVYEDGPRRWNFDQFNH